MTTIKDLLSLVKNNKYVISIHQIDMTDGKSKIVSRYKEQTISQVLSTASDEILNSEIIDISKLIILNLNAFIKVTIK